MQRDLKHTLLRQNIFTIDISYFQRCILSWLLHLLFQQLFFAIDRINRIVQAVDHIFISFNGNLKLTIADRCDGITYACQIHLILISGQVIERIAVIRKRNLRTCCCPHICRHVIVLFICHIAKYDHRSKKYQNQYPCVDHAIFPFHLKLPFFV